MSEIVRGRKFYVGRGFLHFVRKECNISRFSGTLLVTKLMMILLSSFFAKGKIKALFCFLK